MSLTRATEHLSFIKEGGQEILTTRHYRVSCRLRREASRCRLPAGFPVGHPCCPRSEGVPRAERPPNSRMWDIRIPGRYPAAAAAAGAVSAPPPVAAGGGPAQLGMLGYRCTMYPGIFPYFDVFSCFEDRVIASETQRCCCVVGLRGVWATRNAPVSSAQACQCFNLTC